MTRAIEIMMWYQHPTKSRLCWACKPYAFNLTCQKPMSCTWVSRLLIMGVLGLLVSYLSDTLANAATPTSASEVTASTTFNIAFYYQNNLPVDELQAFDIVVIDPARANLPKESVTPHTKWYARVSVQEEASKSTDLNVFISQKISPLWKQGFRGFLLDDGADIGQESTKTTEWLLRVLQEIGKKYPESHLMVRNHLALAETGSNNLQAIIVDSLYQQQKGHGGFLPKVSDALRITTLDQIKRIQAQTVLPVVAIDYCAIGNQPCRTNTASKLQNDGIIPFVTTPDVGSVGVGRIEVMPRKVLVVQTIRPGQPLDETRGVRSIAMPLNYLGYDVQFADINALLPSRISNDRYAGIVVAIEGKVNNAGAWREWLLRHIAQGMRVAFINGFGFPIDSRAALALNLEVVTGKPPLGSRPEIHSIDPMMGFELMPAPDIRDALGIKVGEGGQPLLRVKADNYIYDAAGLTPWGGYVLFNNAVPYQEAMGHDAWAVNPLTFLKQALALPDMPVPDLTSENGRRLMFTHVDGDGFASKGEFAGATNQYSGQILLNQVFTKYPLPMSVSVIEGEIGSSGMYPSLAPVLEPIARRIFDLPNIEVASHTYSHPFFMGLIDGATGKKYLENPDPESEYEAVFSLRIPNYDLQLNREIKGSIDYINQHLTPVDKPVKAIFWSGDAAAPKIALRHAANAGVLNINGGNTIITLSKNSWNNIGPYGVAKGDSLEDYQVYAAVMNENVYTDNWMGPFYGFSRVLETFELTDKPIRFKPIDVYYHFYSGTKTASLKALHTVFSSVLKQPVFPIYTTEYIQRALDWRHVVVAKEGKQWLVRSGSSLRQLRWPGPGVPDLSTASGVTGYLPGPGGLYIHMGGDQASFMIPATQVRTTPYIAQASGFIRNFQRDGKSMAFELGGYYQPFVQLADARRCRTTLDGKPAGVVGNTGVMKLNVSGKANQSIVYHLIQVNCE